MDAEERNLLRTIAGATRIDDTFTTLLEFADRGVSAPVTLLVSGRWVEGELTRREEWADALDDTFDRGLAQTSARLQREQGTVEAIEDIAKIEPGTATPGDTENWRAALRANSFRQAVDESRARDDAFRERAKALGEDEVPPDDFVDDFRLYMDGLKVITLRNVVAVAEQPFHNRHMPMLRVLRSHVGAWHLGRTTTYEGG